MRMLVRQGRIVRHVFSEGLEGRHLDMVGVRSIVSTIPTMPYSCADSLKETFGTFDAIRQGHVRFHFRRVAVHLRRIENGIPLKWTPLSRPIFAVNKLRSGGVWV